MENNTFKGSLFGGFNRQDVMNYIEKASKESAQLLEENAARIAALEQDVGAKGEELSALRAERDRLQSDLKDACASYQATQSELDAAQEAYADLNEALEKMCIRDRYQVAGKGFGSGKAALPGLAQFYQGAG